MQESKIYLTGEYYKEDIRVKKEKLKLHIEFILNYIRPLRIKQIDMSNYLNVGEFKLILDHINKTGVRGKDTLSGNSTVFARLASFLPSISYQNFDVYIGNGICY